MLCLAVTAMEMLPHITNEKKRMERTREFRIFAQILKSLWLQCRILMAHAVPLAPAR